MNFKLGECFEDGGIKWKIILIFRLKESPDIWRYILDQAIEIPKEVQEDASLMSALGLTNQSGKILNEPIDTIQDAEESVSERYTRGRRIYTEKELFEVI